MQNQEAYNRWSATYDTVINKTRDVEALALKTTLSKIDFSNVIELGCGTGKNTEWLARRANHVFAIDFSEQMLDEAKKKMSQANIEFISADITKTWAFMDKKVDLVTCSLILEHIEDLDFIFQQAAIHLKGKGFFYIGELHPFKQYEGSKARFETPEGTFTLACFIHNVSDYTDAARNNGFSCSALAEWFDNDDETGIPRIIAFVFQKK